MNHAPPFPDYASFAEALQRTCVISDPWVEGVERFRLQPIVLSQPAYTRLAQAAEAVAALYDELCEIVWNTPHVLDDFFHLTPYQKLMWLSSGGRWHGIARLDVFECTDGRIQICEMNSDTPSGEAEAVLLNAMLFPSNTPEAACLLNPNDDFPRRFTAMLWNFYRASVVSPVVKPRIGIIYPTELTEDLSMIVLYRQWLEEAGFEVVAGSPFNLHEVSHGRAAMFGKPIDIALRHYKTDWWGEREPVWRDSDGFPDPEPLAKQLQVLLDAEEAGTLAVVNPFGAALTQNKLTMAFCWRHRELFSAQSQETIAAYIPETRRLADVQNETVEKNHWVLKSDYGCEGDEVIIGRAASEEQWRTCLQMAIPERWIVQRYFEAAPMEGGIPNYGVYVIAGRASGIYTRLAAIATDYRAISAPTFIHARL
jgi:glutathionylspermidine synthase